MAMTGVLRPAHCELRVLDLDETLSFYLNILGLTEVARDAAGRVYLKTSNETDQHSLVLRKADRPGMDNYAFKVIDEVTLERLESDLRAYGVATEWIPEGEMLNTGRRVRFESPTGHIFDLFASKAPAPDLRSYTNPTLFDHEGVGINPVRLDHWQIHGTDLDGSVKLFSEVLGFSTVEKIVTNDGKTDLACWMTCSHKPHDVAFVRDERPNTLHHLAYLIGSWEQLLRAADLMSARRVKIDAGPMRHGITQGTTIYAFDPSGNRIETFCGGYDYYPDMPMTVWTENEMGAAVFYHTRELNERFLTVVT
ncbi:catechol 2,3-dioxygenase [Solimonas marina]|uniref:Catechol 2,3-dioxygenase n=1 Tax=Solimonas marina TaxID=2714601 RepID=A0A970B4L6_9GAMM|nr:catechol 2,3-dioxygenase [Solimonas marina]NKF20753.1 catechol 2,3-dioxygenase [Solimonas marina]